MSTPRPLWLADERPAAPHGIPGHLVSFVTALRERGIAVGPSETVDAGRVLEVLDLLDREAVREGLAAALLRRSTHRRTYDRLFDLWFPAVIGERFVGGPGAVDTELPRDESGDVDLDAVRDLLADLLADGSAQARELSRLLAQAVAEQLGRYETRSGPSFSAYQALRDVDPDTLLARILAALLGGAKPAAGASDLAAEVARRTAQERIARFRGDVEDEVRRRTAERIGKEKVAASSVPKIAEQVDFLRARSDELVELRKTVGPLARRLAARLAVRRRRSRRGAIDLRRTLRKSMSTGGVPVSLELRKARPGRPELVILCDVSGSVAGFSHFTLLLVSALREQFSRVRVFAFVDATDEVTALFAPGCDLAVAMTRMAREARIVAFDGHSDYGNALGEFAERFGAAVTSRSSVLVLGDARTNYRDPNVAVLRRLTGTARHVHWLNPEPRAQWGSGDSAADRYAAVVPMHECRTAEQLAEVVARLLPV